MKKKAGKAQKFVLSCEKKQKREPAIFAPAGAADPQVYVLYNGKDKVKFQKVRHCPVVNFSKVSVYAVVRPKSIVYSHISTLQKRSKSR